MIFRYVEDFPAIAQRQLREPAPESHAEAREDERPRGLLARLTHGLSRREDDTGPADKAGSIESQKDDSRPAAPQGQQPIPQPSSEFAKRPQPRRMGEATGATGGLDRQGRMPAAEPVHDEDELEIPAFLRRQSN